ncbi:MAG: isoleucine--tRNA ligase [Planctomycetes bacterium]|nr:isoleucine--tRNA ligase [Planctomycetota bacterium]
MAARKNYSPENTYKDSLNLPRTGFDMKANLLRKEPEIQARWAKDKLYARIRADREGEKRFILHDGPPYANGDIHIGTALNKVLKDMVVRVKNMEGFDSPYVPGWDCHGLPIEQKVTDELGSKARTMSPSEIRKQCQAYADQFAKRQSQQFQRLGVMGEFEDPYITMKPQYEADVLEVFARLVEQGVVYRQLKPVHWSLENRTALADAELEYEDRADPSIYVGFPVIGGKTQTLPGGAAENLMLMIWTTTPWTLPANLAVAVHPGYVYSVVRCQTSGGPVAYVIAQSRLEAVFAAIKAKRPDWLKDYKAVGTLTGKQLLDAGLTYRQPLLENVTCPIVPADYVTLEDGTGLVHTAPGHGLEDYHTAVKHGLKIYCPVLDDGRLDQTAPEFLRGKTVWQANPLVIEHLKAKGLMVIDEMITHSYPHDWRSKKPTIFRATEQWFISVDKPLAERKKSLRELALEVCRRTAEQGGADFIPSWGRNRITGMLDSRPDWCISRQRSWGLPIPAFMNSAGNILMTPASVRAVAAVFAHHGSDAWFDLKPAQILHGYDPRKDKDLKNQAEFQIDQLKTCQDIFDVWFESGSSWHAVAVRRGLVDEVPVDLYLEGSDQHRGWFQLSLLPALGAVGKPPFKAVVTHGFIVDEEGRKMSKSLGNFVSVIDQLNKRGADVLRLYIASLNYQDDVRCSDALIAKSEDAYRKIRNTLRYASGACFDFDPAHHCRQPAEHSIDLWMRMELHELVRDVRAAYDACEFHKATRLLYEFCTVQASSIYFSAVKDRLYCEHPRSARRRATQTVLHELLVTLTRLLAPILVHTCEEAWAHIPFRDIKEPHSVHLAALPDFDEEILRFVQDMRPEVADQATGEIEILQAGPDLIWDRLLELRSDGLAKLEALRNPADGADAEGLKNPLDAEVVFKVAKGQDSQAKLIQTYLRELEDMLGAGFASIETDVNLPEGRKVAIEVLDSRNKYKRCARSWKRRPDVGADKDYPELSARDADVMRQLAKDNK